MSELLRDEFWTRPENGQERYVPVQINAKSRAAVVEITYELLAQMLTDLGWSKVETALAPRTDIETR